MEYTSYYGLFGLLLITLLLMLMCAFLAKRRKILKKRKEAVSTPFMDAAFDGRLPQPVNSYPTPPMPPPAATYGQPMYYHSPSSSYQFPGESAEDLNKPFDEENPPSYEYRPVSPRRSPHQYI